MRDGAGGLERLSSTDQLVDALDHEPPAARRFLQD
jgi:hypothetical protein